MSTIKAQTNKREPQLIRWGGGDPFTHTLCVGPTRCGKTATVLKPIIYQILLAKKRGEKVGLSVIEPKGDVARMVKEMAEDMGLKDELTYIDPLYPDETDRINVMKGDKLDVAEATVAVLKSLFGKQDAFFATVQELSSRKVTLLLKELYGDNMDIMDVLANLRDVTLLQNNVEKLRQDQGTNDLVQFFDNELLGTGQMADKYRQFIVGLRAQLENITSNDHLRAIVTGKSDIDLDEHFEKGTILAVNTALGKLGRSGDAFGMFMAMHLQLATFRRPGTEETRVPHYIVIDEYSRYINPDVERFLSISAEYRSALIAAIQSLGQLEIESGSLSAKAMKRAILTSCRNKIIFGGLEYEDAEEVSRMMGKDMIKERTRMYSGGILENILPKNYKDVEEEKERFHSTFLMDGLPRFHYVHKLLVNGTPQEPGIGVGDFVPRDWKERLEAELEAQKNVPRPPVWKWRDRALYNVKKQRTFEEELRKKRAKEILLSNNPFEEDEEEPVKSTPVFEFKPKVIEPSQEVQQSVTPIKKVDEPEENLVENIESTESVEPVEKPTFVFQIGKKPMEDKVQEVEPIKEPKEQLKDQSVSFESVSINQSTSSVLPESEPKQETKRPEPPKQVENNPKPAAQKQSKKEEEPATIPVANPKQEKQVVVEEDSFW